MNDDFKELQVVLGEVGGGNFAKDCIDDPIDHMKSVIKAADWVKPAIEAYRQPLKDLTAVDPNDFNDAINKFRGAALMLGINGGKGSEDPAGDGPGVNPAHTVTSYVTNAKQTVAGDGTNSNPPWRGDSADAFNKNFVPFYLADGQATKNQAWMLSAMQIIAEAHQAVYARTRSDVKEMLKNASKAADDNDSDFSSPGGSLDTLFTLSAATVALAASVLAPEATGLAIASAAAGYGSTVFGAIPKSTPKVGTHLSINEASPGAIVDSMYTCQNQIQTEQTNQLKEIKKALDDLSKKINGGDRKKMVGPLVGKSTSGWTPPIDA